MVAVELNQSEVAMRLITFILSSGIALTWGMSRPLLN
jgi:hypothetical protein